VIDSVSITRDHKGGLHWWGEAWEATKRGVRENSTSSGAVLLVESPPDDLDSVEVFAAPAKPIFDASEPISIKVALNARVAMSEIRLEALRGDSLLLVETLSIPQGVTSRTLLFQPESIPFGRSHLTVRAVFEEYSLAGRDVEVVRRYGKLTLLYTADEWGYLEPCG
jgi:hypothetical protein